MSHFDADHIDNFRPSTTGSATTPAASSTNEGNLASVADPLPIPPMPYIDDDDDDRDSSNDVTFMGAWCASVNISEDDLEFLADLSSIEREMFLQVEHDLFSGEGTTAMQVMSDESTRSSSSSSVSFFGCDFCHGVLPHSEHDLCPRATMHASTVGPTRFFDLELGCVECANVSNDSGLTMPHNENDSFVSDASSYHLSCAVSADLNYARSIAPMENFVTCYTELPDETEFKGHTFFDPEPPEDFIDPHALMNFLYPAPALQSTTLLMFCWLTLFWDLIHFIVIGMWSELQRPTRAHRRRLSKRQTPQLHLSFLPAIWMILTSTVMIFITIGPAFHLQVPSVRAMSSFVHRTTSDTYQRVLDLDELVSLESTGSLQDYNRIKGEFLMERMPQLGGLLSAFKDSFVSVVPLIQSDTTLDLLDFPELDRPTVIDCVSNLKRRHLRRLASNPKANVGSIASLECLTEPCAFMMSSRTRKAVIFDTGASLAITPDKSDFDGPLTIPKGDLRLGGMANGLKIEGVGPVTWTFANSDGGEVQIRSMAYYVPGAKARLLSPQRLFDPNTGVKGKYEGDHKSFRLHIEDSTTLTIEYDDRNSLPIGYATIGATTTTPQVNLTILDEDNQNLTAGQKLLLHWHHRFGHLNLPAVQRILRAVPFLSATFESASKCDMKNLKCETCEYAKGHRRAKKSATTVPVPDHVGALKVNHLKPGAQVSVDHFESRLLGRTFDSYGKASSQTFKGGCIFVDHASGFMHVEHQLGFSAVETIRAKQNFELMCVGQGVLVESYLTDSGAFSAVKFVKQIRDHNQRIRYCGANTHHKNGVAERAVQKVSNMARALILHSGAHWKDGIDSSLWPMAVTYATHLYNHLPNDQGLCPADLFTGSTVPRHRLRDLHVWGCPVYVLDPHLQAGQKLPRWQPRSRRGVFLGFSLLHSSEVPLVLNLQTGSITPQYHVVFDDHFSTVTSVAREEEPPGHWEELCLENSTFVHTEHNSSETTVYLEDDWLTPDERVAKERQVQHQNSIRRTYDTPTHKPADTPVSPIKGVLLEPVEPSATTPVVSNKGGRVSTKGVQAKRGHAISDVSSKQSRQHRVSKKDVHPRTTTLSDALQVDHPRESIIDISTGDSTEPNTMSDVDEHALPPLISRTVSMDTTDSNSRRSARTTKGMFQNPHYRDQVFLASIDRFQNPEGHETQLAYLAEILTCPDTGVMNLNDPRVYAAKQRGGDADNPTFQQAMNGPAVEEYIAAMKLEVETLVAQRTWDPIPRTAGMNVLKGTWAFKLKRLPDGTAYRYKARFCARGDLQKEGVDFFETYAPVVQWSTIRLLLTTVLTEGWVTRQVDYTNAFVQAELREEVYVEYPRMFGAKSGLDCVLKLRKSLYGLRQAPRTFFEKLKAGLEERGWKQSAIDPCLFLKSGLICVVYVDDTIFAGAAVEELEKEITALGISTSEQRHTFHLRNEGSVSAFLGIQIEKTGPNTFHLSQTGLIAKVLAATNMTDCNGCDTPATSDPLHIDKDGAVFDEAWRYDSVIGMLMYLASNTRPDIAYAVHQAARFTHNPRHSHALGIKRILRYLKKTRTEGLIMQPTSDLKVDCYVDADFAGLFSVEDKQDPISVKSRTGYVIMYRGTPLHWVSKMQTQIALSTMEAEYIALSQSMRDLIPIREVLKEIMEMVFQREPTITYHSHAKAFTDTDVGTVKYTIPQSTVFEDNEACLKFARMPKLTPRTKHIGVPYHWFRSQVERLEIHIEPIDTTKQLGDQFTKGLSADLFRVSRKVLMGW